MREVRFLLPDRMADPPGDRRRLGAARPAFLPGLRGAAARRGVPWPALTGIAAALAVALGAGNLLQRNDMIPPAGREGEQKLATMFLNGIPQAQNAYGTIVLDPMDNLEAAGQRGGAGMDRFRQIGQRDVRFQMRVEVLHRACDAPP